MQGPYLRRTNQSKRPIPFSFFIIHSCVAIALALLATVGSAVSVPVASPGAYSNAQSDTSAVAASGENVNNSVTPMLSMDCDQKLWIDSALAVCSRRREELTGFVELLARGAALSCTSREHRGRESRPQEAPPSYPQDKQSHPQEPPQPQEPSPPPVQHESRRWFLLSAVASAGHQIPDSYFNPSGGATTGDREAQRSQARSIDKISTEGEDWRSSYCHAA
ncbi:hypothetical protein BC835DRAFT_1307056 [Cytidiella melzeri]|nr:hypothetical protein BC835DRAFT_1307056 [Cytidiella melzeri]